VSEKKTCANCGTKYDPVVLGQDPRSNTCSPSCKKEWRTKNRFVVYREKKRTGRKENALFNHKYIFYRRGLVKKLCIKIMGTQEVKKFKNLDFDEIGTLIQKTLAKVGPWHSETMAIKLQGEDVVLKYLNSVKHEILEEIFGRISNQLDQIKEKNEMRKNTSNRNKDLA